VAAAPAAVVAAEQQRQQLQPLTSSNQSTNSGQNLCKLLDSSEKSVEINCPSPSGVFKPLDRSERPTEKSKIEAKAGSSNTNDDDDNDNGNFDNDVARRTEKFVQKARQSALSARGLDNFFNASENVQSAKVKEIPAAATSIVAATATATPAILSSKKEEPQQQQEEEEEEEEAGQAPLSLPYSQNPYPNPSPNPYPHPYQFHSSSLTGCGVDNVAGIAAVRPPQSWPVVVAGGYVDYVKSNADTAATCNNQPAVSATSEEKLIDCESLVGHTSATSATSAIAVATSCNEQDLIDFEHDLGEDFVASQRLKRLQYNFQGRVASSSNIDCVKASLRPQQQQQQQQQQGQEQQTISITKKLPPEADLQQQPQLQETPNQTTQVQDNKAIAVVTADPSAIQLNVNGIQAIGQLPNESETTAPKTRQTAENRQEQHLLNTRCELPVRRIEKEQEQEQEQKQERSSDQVVIEIETDCEEEERVPEDCQDLRRSAFVPAQPSCKSSLEAGDFGPSLSEFDVQRFSEYLKAARQLQWRHLNPNLNLNPQLNGNQGEQTGTSSFQCYDELLAEFVSEQQEYAYVYDYNNSNNNSDSNSDSEEEEDEDNQSDKDSDRACQCHECLVSQEQTTSTCATDNPGVLLDHPAHLTHPNTNTQPIPNPTHLINGYKMREVNGQLRGLLKKPNRPPPARKNRVVFDETRNEFFEADYIILIREDCAYDEEDEEPCTCGEHELVRLCCEEGCQCNYAVNPAEAGEGRTPQVSVQGSGSLEILFRIERSLISSLLSLKI